MTYEDIKKANESIVTTTIERKDKHGNVTEKEYAEVNQRIKAFRMCYPEGYITTEIISLADGVCVMKAKVGYYLNGCTIILGTGTAYEREDSTYINKTSYIENCETSAVGRALGMAGFGIDTSVASAEEVQNAMANQEPKKEEKQPEPETKDTRQPDLITPVAVKEITVLAEKAQVPISEVLKAAKISKLEEMTAPCAEKMKATLKRTITKRAREAKNGTAGQTA